MKRPAGVVITAVLQVLGSLLTLVMAVLTAIIPHFAPRSAAQPQLPAGLFVVTGGMYFIFAVTGLATAVGVFQLKRWARYSTLIFAGILAGLGLLMAVVFAIMPFQSPPQQTAAQLPPNFAIIFKTVMVLIQLAIAGLGAWWLYYFRRAGTKLRFEGEVTDDLKTVGRRPLSIAVLAVVSFLGLPWMLVGAWMAFPVAFFGMLVQGMGARIVYLAFAVTAFYIGVGLWRLMPASRLAAIGVYVIGCLNTMLFYALPGREERYHRMIAEASQRWHLPEMSAQPQQFLIGAWLGIIGASVLAAIAIYYLVTRRFAFQTASTVVPSDHPPVLPAN